MKEIQELKLSPKKKVSKKTNIGLSDIQPLVTFFLVSLLFVVSCVISKTAPFGEYTVLTSDLEAQFAPFIVFWKNHLANVDFSSISNAVSSLLYGTGLGLGKNIMGTFAYYMSSPFNFLAFLFDASDVSVFVILLMMLKLSFAGAFMCLFIHKRSSDKSRCWPILFGVIYAFSSWAMVFLFCIIWLDGFLLLPLILYFIEVFMEKGKYSGLVVSLLFLFLSNYYIAYMVGVFSFFYLLVRMYMDGSFADKKASIRKILKFILIAAICAACMMIVILPAGLDTIKNSDPTTVSYEQKAVSFTFIKILDQIFFGTSGTFNDVLPSNMPFVFSSLLVTVLCVMFFVSRAFDRKTKIVYGIIFGLMYLSFNITALDLFWQAFDTPNWFCHRYSFVFLPFMFIVALRVLEKINEITGKEFLKTAGIIYALLLAAQSFGSMSKEDRIYLFNFLFIAVILVSLYFLRKDDWSGQLKDMGRLLPFILGLLVASETALINPQMSSGVSGVRGAIDDLNYRCALMASEECAELATDSTYRMDVESNGYLANFDSPSYQPSLYTNHNGFSYFNSNSNKKLGRFLKQLGYDVNYNYFASEYSYSAPATDAFMSMRYIYSLREYPFAEKIGEDTRECGYTFYENTNVLPIAFKADGGAADFDFYSLEGETEEKDYFTFQEKWYESMFPGLFEEGFYDMVPDENVSLVGVTNASYYNPSDYDQTRELDSVYTDSLGQEKLEDYEETEQVYYRNNSEIPMVLDYDVTVEETGELYFDLSSARNLSEFSLIVNGEELYYIDGSCFSRIFRLGQFEAGDVVRVSILVDDSEFELLNTYFATFNEDNFNAGFTQIDKDAVEITTYENGHVVLNADMSDGEMIITTIPYEDGWTLYVDGVAAEITPYQDAFIGISGEEGQHTYELRFVSPGFRAGSLCSLVGIAGLVCLGIIDRKKRVKEA